MFAYIWEYKVKEHCIADFRRIYSPEGDWVRLFRKSEGFIRTEFFQDVNTPNKFITTDYWESKKHRDRFRQDFGEEFVRLDKQCESLTIEKRIIGDFELQA